MKDAAEYLYHVKAIILSNAHVMNIEILREEAFEELGLFRFRLKLSDDSLLECFERFSVEGGIVQVSKYSFHWQDTDGQLRLRWDNAAHHSEISSHPHHLHHGREESIVSSKPMDVEKVLGIIAERINE